MFNENNHDKRKSVNLTESEVAVLAAASRLFSAYIAQGKVDESSENKVMALALRQAIKLAKNTDDVIRSGKEL